MIIQTFFYFNTHNKFLTNMDTLQLSTITTRRNLLVDDHPNITDRRSSEDEEDIIIDPETADFPVEWQVVDRIHGDHIDTVKSILSSYDTSIIERMSWDAIDELGDNKITQLSLLSTGSNN